MFFPNVIYFVRFCELHEPCYVGVVLMLLPSQIVYEAQMSSYGQNQGGKKVQYFIHTGHKKFLLK